LRLRLAPGERVLIRTRPQPRALAGPFCMSLLVLAAAGFALGWLGRNGLPEAAARWQPWAAAGVVAAGALVLLRIFVRPLLRWLFARYVLTSRRIVFRRGLVRRREHEIALAGIYQLDTAQTLFQRLTGSGTLTVDLGHDRVVSYANVPQVDAFKAFVVAAIRDLPLTAMFDGVDISDTSGTESGWRGDEG
jgi:membrane protein YdbS with pleckstrin-like domain